MCKWVLCGVAYFLFLLIAYPSWAVCPLITDNTEVHGQEICLLELNGQSDGNKEDFSVRTAENKALPTLSDGIVENVDMILRPPCLCEKSEASEMIIYDGQGCDTALETKVCLFEKNEFTTIALKPEIDVSNSNDKKGPGIGQQRGHLFLTAFQEWRAWAIFDNLGCVINKNKSDEHRNTWPVSFAAIWEAVINFKLAANVDSERNHDDETGNDPALPVGGIIYSINKNFDVNLGVKRGLSISATDLSLITGVTFRF